MLSTKKKILFIIISLTIGLLIGIVLGEVVLRLLLFSDISVFEKIGRSLRSPSLYADGLNEDDYWKLAYRFGGTHFRPPPPDKVDTTVGWVNYRYTTPNLYDHKHSSNITGRRPLILYGDSFAQCATPPGECFQGILDQSDLSSEYALLNYGVGGYGIGQIYLLLKHSIDRYVDADPVVIVGIFERDLDRTVLSFRTAQKPRFRINGDTLVVTNQIVRDTDAYLSDNPVSIRSYLYRYLVYGTFLLPEYVKAVLKKETSYRQDKIALGRVICRQIQKELERRGLQYFFLYFDSQKRTGSPIYGNWRKECLYSVFHEYDIPFISSGAALRRHAQKHNGNYSDYYMNNGHLNYLGNQIVFAEMEKGLQGFFESPGDGWQEKRDVIDLLDDVKTHGAWGTADYVQSLKQPVNGLAEADYFFVHPGTDGPTELLFKLDGQYRQLKFLTKIDIYNRTKHAGSVGLCVFCDGKAVLQETIRKGDPMKDKTIDVTGVDTVKIRVADGGDGIEADHLYILRPCLVKK